MRASVHVSLRHRCTDVTAVNRVPRFFPQQRLIKQLWLAGLDRSDRQPHFHKHEEQFKPIFYTVFGLNRELERGRASADSNQTKLPALLFKLVPHYV